MSLWRVSTKKITNPLAKITSRGRPDYVPKSRPTDVPYGQRHPKDILKTSLYGSMSEAKKHPRDNDFCIWLLSSVLASMKVILLKWLHSTAGWWYKKKEYELLVLNWITRRIYFFHQKCYQILFMFHQFNKFL